MESARPASSATLETYTTSWDTIIQERRFWNDYRKAYEKCIAATSTADSPWYVVPADDKDNARLIVSQIVVDALENLKAVYPETTPERMTQLQSIRAALLAE